MKPTSDKMPEIVEVTNTMPPGFLVPEIFSHLGNFTLHISFIHIRGTGPLRQECECDGSYLCRHWCTGHSWSRTRKQAEIKNQSWS